MDPKQFSSSVQEVRTRSSADSTSTTIIPPAAAIGAVDENGTTMLAGMDKPSLSPMDPEQFSSQEVTMSSSLVDATTVITTKSSSADINNSSNHATSLDSTSTTIIPVPVVIPSATIGAAEQLPPQVTSRDDVIDDADTTSCYGGRDYEMNDEDTISCYEGTTENCTTEHDAINVPEGINESYIKYNRFIDAAPQQASATSQFFQNQFVEKCLTTPPIPLIASSIGQLNCGSYVFYVRILSIMFPHISNFPPEETNEEGDTCRLFHRQRLDTFVESNYLLSIGHQQPVCQLPVSSSSMFTTDIFNVLIDFIPVPTGREKLIVNTALVPIDSFDARVRIDIVNCIRNSASFDDSILFIKLDRGGLLPSQKRGKKTTFSFPLSIDIKKDDQTFIYQLAAVIYQNSNDTADTHIHVIAKTTKVNKNHWMVYSIKCKELKSGESGKFPARNRIPEVLPTSKAKHYIPDGKKGGKKKKVTLLPETYIEDKQTYLAVGTVLVRVRDHPCTIRNPHAFIYAPFLNYAGRKISSFEIDKLCMQQGWLEDSVVDVLVQKGMDYFHDSRNIFLGASLFAFIRRDIEDSTNPETNLSREGLEIWSRGLYDNVSSLFDSGNVLHIMVESHRHWYYAFVVMNVRKIIVVDSMNNKDECLNIGCVIKMFLHEEYDFHHRDCSTGDQWEICVDNVTPQQQDGGSCGVFAVLNCLRVMRLLKDEELWMVQDYFWEDVLFEDKEIKAIRGAMCEVLLEDKTIEPLLNFTFV